MPEEYNVEYKFTGNIDSLQKAVASAIGLLDKYQEKMDSVGEAVSDPAQKISEKLREPLKQVMAEVDRLQQKFKELQNTKIFQNSIAANQMALAMKNLQQQLTSFQSRSKITATDVKDLANTVRNTEQAFAEAGPQIDNIVQKEQKFQEVLNAIRERSNSMAEAMRNAFGKISGPLDGAVSKLESFKAKAAEALNHVSRMAEAAGSGFRQFKGSVESASDAGDAAASGIAAIGKTVTSINPKVAIAAKVFQTLTKVTRTIPKIFRTAQKAFDFFGISLGSLTDKVQHSTISLKQLTHILGGAGLGYALSNATKSAISFIENLNLFTVAMGDSVDEALRFVDRMSEIYGMDPSNIYRYAGYFYQLTDAIGSTSEASKIMSLSLTKAANDISSLFNVDIETVINDLASGMQGMSRAVRKYGMDIRATTLQQTALNYGFTENISTTSEANRMALRYLTMMQQVKNATKQVTTSVGGATEVMGDFARNIETPANQLRILKEQVSQVARAFGNFLIPVMQKVLYVVNGVLMALKTLLTFLASLAGIDIGSFGGEISKGADEAASAVGGIGSAADKTAKKLRKLIAPFDELTILTEPSDSGAGGGGIGGLDGGLDPKLLEALENMSLGLDEIRMKALDVRDKILELLGLEFDANGNIVATVGGFIDDLINLWDAADYEGFGSRIAEFLNQGIAWGIAHTDPAKYAPILNEKIQILARVLNGLVSGFNWEGLGTIIGQGITIALGMLNTFLETFNWAGLGAGLAKGLNGIIYAVDWNLIGETIGNYFMAKVRGLTGFFETFDWAALGRGLANGLMTLLNTIQWDEMGHMFAQKFNGIIDAIRAFWATYEWGTLGSSLAEYFSTIFRELNWKNLGGAISDTLRGLLREISSFLGQLDWYALGKGIAEMLMGIDWLGLLTDVVELVFAILGGVVRGLAGVVVGIFTGIGKDIKEGFQNGIVAGFKNIGAWLKEHLVDPVVRAVKNFFGIHSPSTVFEDIGGNLIKGLLNGITNALRNIVTWIRQNIIDPVVNSAKSGFGIAGGISTIFKTIGTNVVSGLMFGLKTVGGQLSSWGNNLKNTILGIFNGVQNTVSSAVGKISGAANSIVNSVSSAASKVASKANEISAKSQSILSNSGVSKVSTKPKMATGGVVRGPTEALIGEGKYAEAVIPLGNSPELAEMIDKIANAVSVAPRTNNSERPIEVYVYLDGEEITTKQNRVNRMYGRTQQNI